MAEPKPSLTQRAKNFAGNTWDKISGKVANKSRPQAPQHDKQWKNILSTAAEIIPFVTSAKLWKEKKYVRAAGWAVIDAITVIACAPARLLKGVKLLKFLKRTNTAQKLAKTGKVAKAIESAKVISEGEKVAKVLKAGQIVAKSEKTINTVNKARKAHKWTGVIRNKHTQNVKNELAKHGNYEVLKGVTLKDVQKGGKKVAQKIETVSKQAPTNFGPTFSV
jgi:hypothetical protein